MAQLLDLDFQQGPSQFHWSGIALLVAGVLAVGAVANSHFALTGELNTVSHRVEAAERTLHRQAPKPKPAVDLTLRTEESRQANEILGLLSLPWQDALAQVEDVDLKDVALLQVEPDMQKGVIRLGGEAKSYEAILAYMKALQKRPGIEDVVLQTHQVELQKPGEPTRFLLVARWTKRT